MSLRSLLEVGNDLNIACKTVNVTSAAKGDILVCTGSGVFIKLPVGTNGQVLTANSAVSCGMNWA